MQESLDNQKIYVHQVPNCSTCGYKGVTLHDNLQDKLFGVIGKWGMLQCPKCRMAWLNPMPNVEDIWKAYKTYYTHQIGTLAPSALDRLYGRAQHIYALHKYGYKLKSYSWIDYVLAKLIGLHPGRREDAAFKIFYLPKKNGGKLLEVGCGNGEMLATMRELEWQVEGVDFDPNAVKAAESRGLKVRLGGLLEQRYPSNSFDAIVMSHVIEHVPEPSELIKESYRILKDGGSLTIVTPNIKSWGHKLYEDAWRGLEPPRHLQIFSKTSLSKITMRSGFTKLKCRSSIRGARGMFIASINLRRRNKGKDNIGSNTIQTLNKLKVELMEIVEGAILFTDEEAGEELVLFATK